MTKVEASSLVEGAFIENYRGYRITVAPAFQREYRFNYTHVDYDGPEDRRCGAARSIEECREKIDEDEGLLCCTQCGEPTAAEDFSEGVCSGCARFNQIELDAHNELYGRWRGMNPAQREAAIRWGMR